METLYGIATVKMQGMAERRIAHWLNLEIDTINTGIRITRMDMLFGGSTPSLPPAIRSLFFGWEPVW